MLLKIHPDNPSPRQLAQVVDCLRKGGLIIYPTDTVYGLGCDISNGKAIERLCRLKGIKPEKANFSFICSDLSHLSDYTKPIDTATFRLLKLCLPGPYTFILPAANSVPKMLNSNRKTVGIRVPNHNIALQIVKELGHPIISTSLHDDDEILNYSTDPELIHDKYEKLVDLVIDGGYGELEPSTIIDCTVHPPEVIREGKGAIDML